MPKNLFFAHSGGVTSVLNTIAASLITTAKQHADAIPKVLIGQDGILGALQENMLDASQLDDEALRRLAQSPASAFGTCRYKLKSITEHEAEYRRLIEVFQAHDIGYFVYNGGNDSQDTTHKVWQMSQEMGYPLQCLGLPKTVDNDLVGTDCCPGFGSVAKYIATSTLEASLDVAAMATTSTKVFVLEVMGRHAGWIAASSALAQQRPYDPPHLILLPEVTFDPEAFCLQVQQQVAQHGYCVVVASEGIRDAEQRFVAEADGTDAFGHKQLGGVAPKLAQLVTQKLGLKNHWAVADYLQRSARHLASKTDIEQAQALGQAAITQLLAGATGKMLTITRLSDAPYTWTIGDCPLTDVANAERPLPAHFIREDGWHVTDACRAHMRPWIMGEAPPTFAQGIPEYMRYEGPLVAKKCAAWHLA